MSSRNKQVLTLFRFSVGRQSIESNARGESSSECAASPSSSCDDRGEAGAQAEGSAGFDPVPASQPDAEKA